MSEPIHYEEGQRFVCPQCHMKSIVRIKHELKDFKVVGSYPICAFCHARLDTVTATPATTAPQSDARKALSKLFGEDSKEETQSHSDEARLKAAFLNTETHFCRDCRHYIKHPFLSRCELHHRPVEPMDDCSDFTALSAPRS